MLLISHRGNLSGPDVDNENKIKQIKKCILSGYNVEIDIWAFGNEIFLGHDKPEEKIDIQFLLENKSFLWCHTKNIKALEILSSKKGIKYFWHQEDEYTITSNKKIWVYPGKKLINGSIVVMPERSEYSISEIKKCFAICTDNVLYYDTILKRSKNDK